MSDAVQEAIAKARAGGKKASAKDAKPAASPEPAPLVTASSALPAHEIEVLTPAQSDVIEQAEVVGSIHDTPAEAARNAEWDEGSLGREEAHVGLPIGEVVTAEVDGKEVSGVLTDVVRLEAPPVVVPDDMLASEANDLYGEAYGVDWVYEGDGEPNEDSPEPEGLEGYHWGTPSEPVTAPSGDVHPAFAKLPPAGMSVPVFKG